MREGDFAAAFQEADLANLPDVKSLTDYRTRILWTLWVGQELAGASYMTAHEVSVVLRDVYRISISRQRVEAVLAKERGTVAKRRKAGRRAYQIMREGIDLVGASSPKVVFIDPENALSNIREAESLLGELEGLICVCDPYVDSRTLDLLAECTKASNFRLLTVQVNKTNPFRRDLKAFVSQRGNVIEVRLAPKGVLHDRYVIDNKGMLIFGTSLNGFGFKQSFVVVVGPDVRDTTLAAFDRTWSAATQF